MRSRRRWRSEVTDERSADPGRRRHAGERQAARRPALGQRLRRDRRGFGHRGSRARRHRRPGPGAARRDDAGPGRLHRLRAAQGERGHPRRAGDLPHRAHETSRRCAVSTGGVDYLTKPFEPRELLARVGLTSRCAGRSELEEQNARREIEAHQRSGRSSTASKTRSGPGTIPEIVGRSPSLAKLLDQIDVVAPTDSTVLIQGETGTGKELVARAIHDRSPRRERAVRRGQLRGAAPRARRERALRPREGRLHRRDAAAPRPVRARRRRHAVPRRDRRAPARAQAKLLRVLQEQRVRARGRRADAAASTCASSRRRTATCGSTSAAGEFREDLYLPAQRRSRSRCRRCASGARTSRSRRTLPRRQPRASWAGHSRRLRRRSSSARAPTTGPATCASSRT